MKKSNEEWARTRNSLVETIKQLGFPGELGAEIAKNLGSIRAMNRMISYLNYEKPRSAEIIVDEMLAICGEIDAWRNKKDSERANAKYNEMLRRNS